MKKIKEFFNNLSPEKKKKVVITLVVLGGIVLGVGMYVSTRGTKTEAPVKEQETSIKLQPDILQKSLYMQQQAELEKRDKQLEELKKELEEMKKSSAVAPSTVTSPPLQKESSDILPPPPPPVESSGVKGYPPTVTLPPTVTSPPLVTSEEHVGQAPQKVQAQEVAYGDVQIVSQPQQLAGEEKKEEKKKREIYLPPSFMEATLLSGLDAPTSLGGKSNPVPVLIRIKDLAILPNDIKARLKGCFVIAEGIGNLASERAEMRVVSLTCLDKKGKSVIDSDVDGVVVDQDGKVGLRGKVVAKMGATIARSALAGFFGGVGEGIKASTITQTTTPLGGTTQTVKPEDVLKAGVGTGIANAFGELQKFYMELARQTMPVIEVGAGRTVSVIITKGKSLEIKDTCGGEECLF